MIDAAQDVTACIWPSCGHTARFGCLGCHIPTPSIQPQGGRRMSEAKKRNDKFSKSREFAKELVADSIITDAAAQFIALMIEEIHKTKIKPLQDELARRADLPPTLSAAMELPEVRALVEALENMTGAFDAPIARRKLSGEMPDEARKSARAALAPFKEAAQ